jgi:hypothetical protein
MVLCALVLYNVTGVLVMDCGCFFFQNLLKRMSEQYICICLWACGFSFNFMYISNNIRLIRLVYISYICLQFHWQVLYVFFI